MVGLMSLDPRHSGAGRLRRAVQGYVEPDFHLPPRDPDFLDDEAQEFLPLVEIQSVNASPDFVGEAFDPVPQPVLLSQLLALIDQCPPLRPSVPHRRSNSLPRCSNSSRGMKFA